MAAFGDNWAHIPKAKRLVTLAWLEPAEQLQQKGMGEGGRPFSQRRSPWWLLVTTGTELWTPTALRTNKERPTPTSALDTFCSTATFRTLPMLLCEYNSVQPIA